MKTLQKASAALICVLAAVSAAASDTGLAGKSGAGLMAAISERYRPSELVEPETKVFLLTDGSTGRTLIYDRYADRWFDPEEEVPYISYVLPAKWWERTREPGVDLFNLFPSSADVESVKRNYPPGQVETPKWDNGLWKVGTASLSGFDVMFYKPAAQYLGDWARACMYVAVMYRTQWLAAEAFMTLDGTDYPVLTPLAAETFLDWHRSDPVDDPERRRNDAVKSIQGNRNPFVDYPELAEYLWGDRKGEAYMTEGEETPLHSTYSSTEEFVYLKSDEVPGDASWTLDGKRVDGDRIAIAGLGAGEHHLKFRSAAAGCSGMIKITVRK